MFILGIESSCDDTSVALLDCSDKGHFVIAEKTASQIEIHKKYGGVVPEVAGRMHAEAIVPLIEEVLKGQPEPEAIAVTAGPGLITGLLVGVEAARALSFVKKIPLVAVNHIEGHIHSVEIRNQKLETGEFPISNFQFPALVLVVSGGHTELILMKDHGDYKVLGKTKDDAAGECFDKVAKLLDLPYPGGPQISKFAETGNTKAINFPRPMLDQKSFSAQGGPVWGLDFSFAGLKTSALYWLRDNRLSAAHMTSTYAMPAGVFGVQPEPPTIEDFCASVEQAIVDVLVAKALRAAQQVQPNTIILAGGVSANKKLRTTLESEIKNLLPNSYFLTPSLKYCMDNAAMIAVAGYYKAKKNQFVDWRDIGVDPNWRIA